jgi:hypothetical protein
MDPAAAELRPCAEHGRGCLIRLTRFSRFLTPSAASAGLPDVDRELVERYLATRAHHRDARDIPAGGPSARLGRRAAPGRRNDLPGRLWLRITSACALPFDCLIRDGQGAPCLRYVNTKMNREAAVPVDDELEAAIGAQQRRVLRRWPDGSPHLFPTSAGSAAGQPAPTGISSTGGWMPATSATSTASPSISPRTSGGTFFGTRLVNRDVPLEVIRILLDHESTGMTAYYAKISDETVRRHWENGTRVNINGERVTIGPDGPLAQAQWAKTRYGMATQTLPNGWCGLPIQKRCPHANACLTGPVFLTGPEFLPELRKQRRRTLTLIDVSQNNGQARLAEMNAQVLANLGRMIGEIDKDTSAGAVDAS